MPGALLLPTLLFSRTVTQNCVRLAFCGHAKTTKQFKKIQTIPIDTLTNSKLFEKINHEIHSKIPNAKFRIVHGRKPVNSNHVLETIIQKAKDHHAVPTLRVVIEQHSLPQGKENDPAFEIEAPESRIKHAQHPCKLFSFFEFLSIEDSRIAPLENEIDRVLRAYDVLGTVYIASEGINGQLSVPTAALGRLITSLRDVPELQNLSPNMAQTIDPGDQPYRRLIVRQKAQIITDGLTEKLDLQDEIALPGRELSPSEWHSALSARSSRSLVLDCRNDYESKLGTFEGAESLGTSKFSETWAVLRDRLHGVPRDTPVYTFCTGGIRCVKVNAWLRDELGFTNTSRLRDGIHGYIREVHLANPERPRSLWRGENFVFHRAGVREFPPKPSVLRRLWDRIRGGPPT